MFASPKRMNNKVFLWPLVIYLYLHLCVISLCSADGDPNINDNEISRGLNIRSLLEKITSTLMSRSGDGSSQVLSLNLSNLLILVLLKALIFAAGSIGAGGWKSGYGGYGRNSDVKEDGFINDTEVLLYLGYLSGSPGNYQCLQNVACHRPQQAIQYSKAGGLLIKAAKIIPKVIEMNPTHEQTLIDLRKSADFGQSGGNCDLQYICKNNRKK